MLKYLKRLMFFLILLIVLASTQREKIISFIHPLDYQSEIEENSEKYKVDKYLVAAIINVESGFNKEARSNMGAIGLMQIMPETGREVAQNIGIDFNENSLYESDINIAIGTWYIGKLIDEFDGNVENALAAYNGGMGNVYKWLEDSRYSRDGITLDSIPFPETEDYVKKVKDNYQSYLDIYGGKNEKN